jgi:hypothetical protein
MVRRRLGRGGGTAGRQLPPRRTRLEREDLQAIALLAFGLALLAVGGFLVHVGSVRFLAPGQRNAVSVAASIGQASDEPASAAPLPGSVAAPSSIRPSPTTAASPEPSPSPDAAPTTVGEPDEVLVEEFHLVPMGTLDDPSWRVSPPDAAVTIVAVPTSVDRSLHIQAAFDGGPVVACRDLDKRRRSFTVEATFRVDGEPAAGPLMSIGTQEGAVRLGRDGGGRLAHGDSDNVVGTDLHITPGDWYRVIVDVDLESRTYGIEARAVESAARVRLEGLVLGQPSADVDGVCFAATGAPDASTTVDEVRITAP